MKARLVTLERFNNTPIDIKRIIKYNKYITIYIRYGEVDLFYNKTLERSFGSVLNEIIKVDDDDNYQYKHTPTCYSFFKELIEETYED